MGSNQHLLFPTLTLSVPHTISIISILAKAVVALTSALGLKEYIGAQGTL